ncbi:hypothetical protein B0H14DRAFT_3588470 [Mycena olivaceomarginata]|nr:hypothetical protein B0H14DRAFT_3588470 [Mycena olivaceomarginata]
MSTPAALVGSRLRVEVRRSGSGGGESHLHLHSDMDGWDVDPTRVSPSVGGPERVACGERVAEAEAARGAAVQMRGGCGAGRGGVVIITWRTVPGSGSSLGCLRIERNPIDRTNTLARGLLCSVLAWRTHTHTPPSKLHLRGASFKLQANPPPATLN